VRHARAAVRRAAEIARPVRPSPFACLRELDMFRDYKHRGEAFAAASARLALPSEAQINDADLRLRAQRP